MTTTEWLRAKIGPSPNPTPLERATRSGSAATDFFTDYLRPEMRVLHAYCGDGMSTYSLATYVPMGEVTGIDPDTSNLRRARSRSYVSDAGDVSFERCTLSDLPFGPDEFDAVLVDGAFSTEASPERALDELKRVLAPGGLLGVRHTVPSSRVATGDVPLIERSLRRRDTVQRDLGGNPDVGLKQPALLREAGFVNLRITSSAQQKSDDELLVELAADGFVPVEQDGEHSIETEESPAVFFFETAIETVCWRPF